MLDYSGHNFLKCFVIPYTSGFLGPAEGAGILKKLDGLKNNVNNQNIKGIWYFKTNQNLSIVEGCYALMTQVNNFLSSQMNENLYRKYQTK